MLKASRVREMWKYWLTTMTVSKSCLAIRAAVFRAVAMVSTPWSSTMTAVAGTPRATSQCFIAVPSGTPSLPVPPLTITCRTQPPR